MMTATVAGRMYYGATHEWTQGKGTDKEQDRTLFRGRLNYRNPETGTYHNIDAVCFRDFGENAGLVGWLEEHYLGEGEHKGGQAIIVTGYVRPVEKKKTVAIKIKSTGKMKDIPNIPYDSFEFVILTATYPPTSHGDVVKSSVDADDDDFDIDDEDEFELANDDEEGADSEEENDDFADDDADEDGDDEPTPPPSKSRQKSQQTQKASSSNKGKSTSSGKSNASGKTGSSKSSSSSKGKSTQTNKAKKQTEDEAKDFFD